MNTLGNIAIAGHNRQGATVVIELRLFNSLVEYAGEQGSHRPLQLVAGSTVGDLVAHLGIPHERVWLVLVNGRDITRGLVGAPVRENHELEDGDVVALSGPVPYSYGMGSPIV